MEVTSTRHAPLGEPGQTWLGKHGYLLAAAVLAIAAVAVSPFDVAIGVWAYADQCPGELRRILDVAESFGNGWGVALILIAVCLLLTERRIRVARMAAMAFGAGMAANLGKLLVARWRPRAFTFEEADGVASTFTGFCQFLSGSSDVQSFPSAHSATAIGLAFALAWLVPRARWYFFLLAGMVMLQRIESSAHWPSDTLFGAAIGCLVAGACMPGRRIGRLFDRLESND